MLTLKFWILLNIKVCRPCWLFEVYLTSVGISWNCGLCFGKNKALTMVILSPGQNLPLRFEA